ncbi:hypothetical protein [Mesorhizobium sp. M1B.F.Ca.ET.045.04.1.1]|uniref:hypothetical protein n=1 Tax=Mesorhizobium sp. M1B.F.Ca.ET.045.04.1.1 TaxID=2493673 RepID=UPI00167A6A31|nr:hypothetical protein [Mesorhizobium sp. M1B.F.Ca.ET.045.04.1.1]
MPAPVIDALEALRRSRRLTTLKEAIEGLTTELLTGSSVFQFLFVIMRRHLN